MAQVGPQRTDLFWGAVSTTGRAAGTADGHAPVGTLWADRTGWPDRVQSGKRLCSKGSFAEY